MGWVHVPFTTAGTTQWTAPAGIKHIFVTGLGAGAGGGGGTFGNATTTRIPGGGGGGGGAVESTVPVDVTPGAVYDVIVGAKGPGGAADTDGTSGGDSRFVATGGTVATDLASFSGAGGGPKGINNSAVVGGTPMRTGATTASSTAEYNGNHPLLGRGGAGGTTSVAAHVGYQGQQGAPGTAGANGGISIANGYHGGGGGGGGGGSVGAGGNGANGGGPGDPGTGGVGGTGSNATAPGAGGGGGGGGGCGSTGGGAGGPGGAGADGRIIISYYEGN